jgi:hypothetical protein
MKKIFAISAALLTSGSVWAGVLSSNPDLYGSILADDLSSGSSAVAAQPGVGDTMGTRPSETRIVGQHDAFHEPDLQPSILNDVGLRF